MRFFVKESKNQKLDTDLIKTLLMPPPNIEEIGLLYFKKQPQGLLEKYGNTQKSLI